MTGISSQQQSQHEASFNKERRRRGRAARGLRGKAGPKGSEGSVTSFASEHSRTSQSTCTNSVERDQGSISLGSAVNPTRRRTSSKVNLAALLEKESSHDSCRMKAEPQGLTRGLSARNISSHCCDLASNLRRQLSGRDLGINRAGADGISVSTKAALEPMGYSSGESCDSFAEEEEEEIEVLPFDASGLDAESEEEIEFSSAEIDAAFESGDEVPPIAEFEVPPATGGRRSIRLSITNVGADRGSRTIRLSIASEASDASEEPCGDEDGNSSGEVRERFSFVADAAANIADSVKDDGLYEIEIYPGHFVPFRSANEVWKAVAKGSDHTMRCSCLECECELVSVLDCEHVLCPDCHMVNPVFEWPTGVTPLGAAMGLKQEWIHKQNSEVLSVAQLMTGAA